MAVETHHFLLRRGDGRDYRDLATYKAAGGFAAVAKAKAMGPDGIIDTMKKASIRGRGGAGFPAGVKWGFVPKQIDKPKYLVVNGDEGEPGTFKDTYFLLEDPYRLIEGCLICSMALGIHTAYIYIRGEFTHQIRTVEKAIADCHAAGILGRDALGTGHALDIYVHPGAGAYVCGEETALLESIEGKPGQPRLKPPFPALVGLFGCPTVINNVETISSVALIMEKGVDWWLGFGDERDAGTRLVGVSGHVKRPGVYELATGANLKEVIFDVCGGILEDRPLKAVIPGGSSTPVLLPDEIDIPLSIDGVAAAGSMLGTAGIIVIAEGTCMVRSLLRLARFYAHESCGQCTPCREGTGWLRQVVDAIENGRARPGDLEILDNVADHIMGNTICALGEAAAMPVKSFVSKFRDEFQAHIDQGGCPLADRSLPRW